MADVLNILLIQNSEDDAARLGAVLASDGLAFRLHRVDTNATLHAALDIS